MISGLIRDYKRWQELKAHHLILVLTKGYQNGNFKVEYHANAKYENPLQFSDKNSMYWSKMNVSNNGKNIPYHASFFFKCHLGFS